MLIPILLLLLGFGILIKGADFLVNGASSAAKKYGISNLAIGLTVVAFGTSMPELIVSLLSALDGKNDASFGNVIGSNNFNLLFILGIAGLIYPLIVQRNTVKYEVPLSLLAAGVLFLLVNDSLWGGEGTGSLSRIDSIIL
jgi:cation:H+ antiporter